MNHLLSAFFIACAIGVGLDLWVGGPEDWFDRAGIVGLVIGYVFGVLHD
jgi:hypothetical protein